LRGDSEKQKFRCVGATLAVALLSFVALLSKVDCSIAGATERVAPAEMIFITLTQIFHSTPCIFQQQLYLCSRFLQYSVMISLKEIEINAATPSKFNTLNLAVPRILLHTHKLARIIHNNFCKFTYRHYSMQME
jgi:hypothetical protein